MSKRFGIVHPNDDAYAIKRLVESGAAESIDRGAPTKEGSNGAVAIMVDGNGTTSERFSGLAKSVSSDTAAANGYVEVILPLPGLVYRGSPKVAGAADTQAEIDALGGKRVPFDLTGTDWTIDSAASDAATNTVVIIGGSKDDDELHFVISPTGTTFE